MEFVRKKGFHLKTKPQVVGEVCMALERDGRLTPKNLVDVSRNKDAPLHNEFEWKDSIAAEKYREVQAGYIIRSVAVKITSLSSETTTIDLKLTNAENEQSIRFFHAVELDGQGYDSVETIGNDEEKFQRLLQLCRKDIKNFKEKYYLLRDYMPMLFQAIDEEVFGEQKKGA
jgi:hypothetical protein